MAIIKIWNKAKTMHRSVPIKYVRYAEAVPVKDGNDKFFVKMLGSEKRIEVDKKNYNAVIEALENA